MFYVYDTGQHGLIAATADQSTFASWYSGGYRVTRAIGDGVNAGKLNTALCITSQIGDNPGVDFAAKVCADYSVLENGVLYGDWYLPSKNEIAILYLQKSVVGGFESEFYWSSTEYNWELAWEQYFGADVVVYVSKNFAGHVRAIRSF